MLKLKQSKKVKKTAADVGAEGDKARPRRGNLKRETITLEDAEALEQGLEVRGFQHLKRAVFSKTSFSRGTLLESVMPHANSSKQAHSSTRT